MLFVILEHFLENETAYPFQVENIFENDGEIRENWMNQRGLRKSRSMPML